MLNLSQNNNNNIIIIIIIICSIFIDKCIDLTRNIVSDGMWELSFFYDIKNK